MKIVGFSKTSLIDWDGCVASTVYLPGCNFRCPACHNRDLVIDPDSLEEIPTQEIESYLRANGDFIDGVVITGGEPTIHRDLREVITWLRSLGMRIKLDTNGSRPEVIEELLEDELLDFIAMDIKAPLNDKYEDVCGTTVPLEKIKRSISLIMESGIDYEFRTTVVPIFLNENDIESIAAFIGGAKKYALQQFRPKNTIDERLTALNPYPAEKIRKMAEVAKSYVKRVVIRGEV
ncbi:MAG: anaerobic ribonucleoside-triphosphate reductase activating protein [Methanomassiliicoccales archaeon]|jgi:pyruvate formate lyase activating enzyme|nr:anaerobic ribonucleoside-triphosphate reductase activating protein [Methanomassiliicoccales archaeon]